MFTVLKMIQKYCVLKQIKNVTILAQKIYQKDDIYIFFQQI
jgi:hypothetical protein